MGPVRESNPGPRAPEARIIPLDQQAIAFITITKGPNCRNEQCNDGFRLYIEANFRRAASYDVRKELKGPDRFISIFFIVKIDLFISLFQTLIYKRANTGRGGRVVKAMDC